MERNKMLMMDIISLKLTLQLDHQQTMVSSQCQLSGLNDLSIVQYQYMG